MQTYKARLVDKRYTQSYDIDNEETLTLLEKMNIVKIIPYWQLILAGNCNNLMRKIVLLGHLEKEVYKEIRLNFNIIK